MQICSRLSALACVTDTNWHSPSCHAARLIAITNGHCHRAELAELAEDFKSMTYLSSLQDASLLPLLAYSHAVVEQSIDENDMPTSSVKIATCIRLIDVFDQNTDSSSTSTQSSGWLKL